MFSRTLKTFPVAALFFALTFSLSTAVQAAPKVITWDDLVPADTKSKIIDFGKYKSKVGHPNLTDFGGNKEEMEDYLLTMDFMKQSQPLEGDAIVTELDGKQVKIAGYITPITFDGDKVIDFLFVPYHGACIHVPPPPANQIVYAENVKNLSADATYDPVWLTGTLKAKPVSMLVANVGYSIENATVEPYTE